MKRTITTLALAIAGFAANAQGSSSNTSNPGNVGINNNNPDPSAVLDISSQSQGILVPRMSSYDRNNIINPANGLMVFDLDENSFFYFNANSWSWTRVNDNLGNHTASMDLDMAGKEIQNASRMAVGTYAPAPGAALDVSSTTSTFLPPRMTTVQRDALPTVPDGSMIYNTDVKKWQGGYSLPTTPLYVSHSSVTSYNPIATGQTMGQTFVSPSTAPLKEITLGLTYTTWSTGDMTCKLYTAPGGTLLATSPDTIILPAQGANTFTFPGVALTANSSYYVEFTVNYSSTHILYHYYGNDTYPGGQAYYNGVADAAKDMPIQVNFQSVIWNDLN